MTHTSLRLSARVSLLVALPAMLVGGCSVDKNAMLAPSGALVSLTPSAPLVVVNGSTTVTVQVANTDGSPVPDGTEVLLAASRGAFESPKIRVRNGAATVIYQAAPEPGLVELQAVSDEAQDNEVLAIASAPVGQIALSVSKPMLPATGGQVELRATVKSETGEPVVGAPVTFQANVGSISSDGPVLTNEHGQASAKLTAGQAVVARARVHTWQSDEVSIPVEPSLELTVTANPPRPSLGQPVQFTATPSDPNRVGVMSFIFGNGHEQSLGEGSGPRSMFYTYPEAGGYNVTAVFVTAIGSEFRQTIRLNVEGFAPAPPPGIIEDPSLPFSLTEVTWLHTNVSNWAVTSRITDIRITSSELCIEHTKAGDWPVPKGRGVEGNPWVFANVNGRWYAATYEWLRPGQTCKGITRDNIGGHTDKQPLESWKPRSGELVGFMVSALARAGQDSVAERSNIVMKRWP